MADWELQKEIEDFLYREAHLLDEHRFDEWLDLFSDDARYLMPLREQVQGDVAPAGHPIIDDDKNMLKARVIVQSSGFCHAETPTSMTCHMISNVIVDAGPGDNEVTARSSFIVRQARKLRDEAWWAGRRTDLLRRGGDGWLIVRREVTLDSTVLPRVISIFF